MSIETESAPVPLTGNNLLEQGEFTMFTRTEYRLEFAPKCEESDWLAEMRKLFATMDGTEQMRKRLICYIADGLGFGEAKFGERYSQALPDFAEALGISLHRLKNLVSMYQQLPDEGRAINIEPAFVEIVAIKSIPDADKVRLLNEAKDDGLTVSDFKKVVASEAIEKGWKKKKKAKVNAVGKNPEKVIADKADPEGIRHMLHAVADFLDDESRFKREQWEDLEYLDKLWGPDLKRMVRATKRLVMNGGHAKK
jgi:hypothetical protein